MYKKEILKLQRDLIRFQSYVAKANEDEGGFESEQCEEIQNTINILDDYGSSDSVELELCEVCEPKYNHDGDESMLCEQCIKNNRL